MINDMSENVIYLCYYKTKSLRSNHVRVSPTTPNMYILKWFRFIIAKIYNILRYVIARTQKWSKGIKNWKITYSVILSVLSNKTNLILGYSSPLKLTMNILLCGMFAFFFAWIENTFMSYEYSFFLSFFLFTFQMH